MLQAVVGRRLLAGGDLTVTVTEVDITINITIGSNDG